MLNNQICTKVIKGLYPEAHVIDFTNPKTGFDYLVNKYADPNYKEKTILLLDIVMPVMNAWVFLAEFEKLSDDIKDNIKIYILSSSVSKSDMARANSNKYVEYYLIKPLTRESIHLMVHVLHKKLGINPTK